MESQYQKWVNLSYLAVAALLAYVVFLVCTKIVGVYELETRIRSIQLVISIVSVAAGGLVFLLLYKNEQTNQFMNEVVVELSRVTWPTQKETTSATIVVMIMVIISGMILGFLDYLCTTVLKLIF